MRNLCILTILVILFSCKDNAEELTTMGNLTITFQPKEASLEGASSILITIEDSLGNLVIDKGLSLIVSNGNYLSESIPLSAGDYIVTRFSVLDENDSILYGTPVRGFSDAHKVDYPLPVAFKIASNKDTSLPLEVTARQCVGSIKVHDQVFCIDNQKSNYLIAYSSVDGSPAVFAFMAISDIGTQIQIESTTPRTGGVYAFKNPDEYLANDGYGTYGYFIDRNKRIVFNSVSGTLFIKSVVHTEGTTNGKAIGTFTMIAKDDQGNALEIKGSFNGVRGMGWLEE
jgi:hypothetical protein